MTDARSYLFAPADSERKIAKARGGEADAVIVDLEDSVALDRKPFARDLLRAGLPEAARADQQLWIRINPLTSGMTDDDIAAALAANPYGLMLPKSESGADVARLSALLDAAETAHGIAAGATRILPIVTETAASMFGTGSYGGVSARLAGMTWGAEDLSAALGASTNRDEDGDWAFTYRMARSLCLVGAVAAGVQPIDTLWADFRDGEGLRRDALRARREGFTGKLAIHPDQAALINIAFTPSDEERAQAQRVIDAFAAQPGVGTIGIDGKMYDLPHLKAAQRIVATRS